MKGMKVWQLILKYRFDLLMRSVFWEVTIILFPETPCPVWSWTVFCYARYCLTLTQRRRFCLLPFTSASLQCVRCPALAIFMKPILHWTPWLSVHATAPRWISPALFGMSLPLVLVFCSSSPFICSSGLEAVACFPRGFKQVMCMRRCGQPCQLKKQSREAESIRSTQSLIKWSLFTWVSLHVILIYFIHMWSWILLGYPIRLSMPQLKKETVTAHFREVCHGAGSLGNLSPSEGTRLTIWKLMQITQKPGLSFLQSKSWGHA